MPSVMASIFAFIASYSARVSCRPPAPPTLLPPVPLPAVLRAGTTVPGAGTTFGFGVVVAAVVALGLTTLDLLAPARTAAVGVLLLLLLLEEEEGVAAFLAVLTLLGVAEAVLEAGEAGGRVVVAVFPGGLAAPVVVPTTPLGLALTSLFLGVVATAFGAIRCRLTDLNNTTRELEIRTFYTVIVWVVTSVSPSKL